MWYLYIAAGMGLIFEYQRPAKYDGISMWAKIMIPTMAGLLWPVIVAWFIINMIREYVT